MRTHHRLSIFAIFARACAYRASPNGASLHADMDEWELDRFWTFVQTLKRVKARA